MTKPTKEGSPKRVRRSPEVLMKELDEKMSEDHATLVQMALAAGSLDLAEEFDYIFSEFASY